jgi:hypothetical protein
MSYMYTFFTFRVFTINLIELESMLVLRGKNIFLHLKHSCMPVYLFKMKAAKGISDSLTIGRLISQSEI